MSGVRQQGLSPPVRSSRTRIGPSPVIFSGQRAMKSGCVALRGRWCGVMIVGKYVAKRSVQLLRAVPRKGSDQDYAAHESVQRKRCSSRPNTMSVINGPVRGLARGVRQRRAGG